MKQVAVTLTNHKAWITDCDNETYEKLRDYWSFYPETYRWSPAYKMWLQAHIAAEKKKARTGVDYDINSLPGWNGKLLMFKRGSLPAGLFRATRWDIEEKLGIKFAIERKPPRVLDFLPGLPASDKEHDYQDECVEAMCKSVKRGGGIVLKATGTGKTATAAKFMAKLAYDCLFVVDQLDLLYQSQKEIAMWLKEEVGVVGDSKYDVRRVTVATRQTLNLHMKDANFRRWYKRVKIIIVDELHEQMGKTNFDVLETVHPIAVFGLTATLQMGKKAVRFKSWAFAGPVIFEFPLSEGVKRNVLTEGKAVQLLFPENKEWASENEAFGDEYTDEVIENKLKLETLHGVISKLVKDKHFVILLAERRLHVEALDRRFKDIDHRIAYGGVKQEDREAARVKFDKGNLNLIIASRVFKKGVNIKRVDVMIDAAEMKSQNDTQQKYGRGVRKHPAKDALLYIDIGTQGTGRYGKRARSRASSLKKLGIQVTKKKVFTVQDALQEIERQMNGKS